MNLNEALGGAAERGEAHYPATEISENLDPTLRRIGRRRAVRTAGMATAGLMVAGVLALAGVSMVDGDEPAPGETESVGPTPTPDATAPAAFDDCDGSGEWDGTNGALTPESLCQMPNLSTVLRSDAAVALYELDRAFSVEFGESLCTVSGYRTIDEQLLVAERTGWQATDPGVSNHGWGIAVDFCDSALEGGRYDWLRANAPDYGWDNPEWARTVGNEPWHWEYVPAIAEVEQLTAELTGGPVTIGRGATLWQIDETLAEVWGVGADGDPYGNAKSVLEQLNAEYDGAFGDSLEGWIAPGTYPASWAANGASWHLRAAESRYEALLGMGVAPADMVRVLTIASLIERDAQRVEDFAGVSAVIHNRFDAGLALELDTTLHYWRARQNSSDPSVFTTAEDREAAHPYNTYRYPGLPPTAIGSPTTAAIEAALNPAAMDDLFFVMVNLETGEIRFAETFPEHLKNVDELRGWIAGLNGDGNSTEMDAWAEYYSYE